jgi:dTDP-glucose 4,6-dehydratase
VGPVNIGNPHELSMLDLARWISEIAGGRSRIVFIDRPEDDPRVRRPDITLAREALGWEPQVSIETGLRRTVAWFRDHANPAAEPAWLPTAHTTVA